jgi:hypothetical protein
MTKKKIISYTNVIDKNNCAPCRLKDNKKDKKFKTCYSKDSLIKIAKAWNKEHKENKPIKINLQSKKQLWNNIQKKMNSLCENNEYCWKKQNFIKKLKDTEIELYTFKPDYPKSWLRNKYTWLNTYDIYYVMKQYEKVYNDFIFIGPIPSDCPTKIQCELSNIDLIKLKKRGINKIGIIYNLDTSNQPGSHWIGIYIDNQNNEINIYDSQVGIGNNLIRQFIERLSNNYIKNNINPIIIYNDKRHQYGGSECGVYSMNFILERLHGKNMYEISQMKILDENMNYLRKLLYNTKIYNS